MNIKSLDDMTLSTRSVPILVFDTDNEEMLFSGNLSRGQTSSSKVDPPWECLLL